MTRFAALLAVAALAATVATWTPSAARAGGSQSYPDPAGDATGGAPDIQTVVVSNDDDGTIRVAVSTPDHAAGLHGDDAVGVVVESSLLKGVVAVYVGGGITRVCAPTGNIGVGDCVPSNVPVSAVFSDGTTTFAIDGNALGADDGVAVVVASLEVVDDGQSHQDVGPMIDYELQTSPAAADTAAPHAKALAATGTHGKSVTLGYRTWDDSGSTREELSLYQGSKRLWRTSTVLAATTRSTPHSQTWKVPKNVRGKLRFSVQAWDGAGNASPVSWATVTVR